MITDLNKIYLKVADLLNEQFSDVYAACLTGSYADNLATEESDIDIWIVSAKRDYVFGETFIREGNKYQVTHYPLSKVEELLWLDIFTRNGVFVGAFVKAKIIKDTDGFLSSFIKKCISIYHQGPESASYLEIHKRKVQLFNSWSDLKGTSSREEGLINAFEIMQHFMFYYSLSYRIWTNGGGKYIARNIKAHNPNLYNEFYECFEKYVQSNEKSALLNFIEVQTDNFSILKNGYSIAPNLIEVKEKYLIIQLFNLSNVLDFAEANLPTILSDVSGNMSLTPFFFRTRTIGDSRFNFDSIYVAIFGDTDYINETLIPYLNSKLLKIHANHKINFPVNLDLSLVLGDKKLIEPFSKWIFRFTSPLISQLKNSISFAAALELFKLVKSCFFASDNDHFQAFNKYLYESWLALAYDSGNSLNLPQLIISENKIIEKFENQFNQQNVVLKEFYEGKEWYFITDELRSDFVKIVEKVRKVATDEKFRLHPVFLYNEKQVKPSYSWVLLKHFLRASMAALMIPENSIAYMPYTIKYMKA